MRSILYYRSLFPIQSFYEGRGICAVYSVYRIVIDILCFDSSLLRKKTTCIVELVVEMLL